MVHNLVPYLAEPLDDYFENEVQSSTEQSVKCHFTHLNAVEHVEYARKKICCPLVLIIP